MPNAATLASEYVPRRQRPVRGDADDRLHSARRCRCGELAARVIPAYGWRTLFIDRRRGPARARVGALEGAARVAAVSGAATRALAGARLACMRRIGHDVPDDVDLRRSAAAAATGASEGDTIGDLFASDVSCATRSALFASFFFCLMVNYVAIQLVPAMLTRRGGFTQPAASRGLHDGSNYRRRRRRGARARCVIQRLGSRVTMLGMSAVAVVCSLVMAGMPLDPSDTFTPDGDVPDHRRPAQRGADHDVRAGGARLSRPRFAAPGVGPRWRSGASATCLPSYVGGYALDQGGSPGYFTSLGEF